MRQGYKYVETLGHRRPTRQRQYNHKKNGIVINFHLVVSCWQHRAVYVLMSLSLTILNKRPLVHERRTRYQPQSKSTSSPKAVQPSRYFGSSTVCCHFKHAFFFPSALPPDKQAGPGSLAMIGEARSWKFGTFRLDIGFLRFVRITPGLHEISQNLSGPPYPAYFSPKFVRIGRIWPF